MSLDNTDSVLQTDNDGELLVQTSDDSEEFVVIPAPRRRAVTVSAFVILLKKRKWSRDSPEHCATPPSYDSVHRHWRKQPSGYHSHDILRLDVISTS